MKDIYISIAFYVTAISLGFAQINFNLVTGTTLATANDGAVAFADFDGDNDQDVLISGLSVGGGSTKLYLNDGTGAYTLVTGTPFEDLRNSEIVIADIDGDNDQDVMITGLTTSAGPSAKLYTNDGNGVFTEVANVPFANSFRGGMAFADVDGDGNQDLMISGTINTSNILKLYLNDGNGIFSLSPNGTLVGLYYGSMAFADVDGDTDLDFLVTGIENSILISKLYINNGAGIFTLDTSTPFIGVYRSSIAFADIDGDNDQDVLITGNSDGSAAFITKLYTNDGTGTFTEVASQPFLNDVVDGDLAFADVDGDGDLDVLIVGGNGTGNSSAKLFENDGTGLFTEVTGMPFVGVRNSAIAFADIDGDSDKDVLITGAINSSEPTTAKLYKNESVLGIPEFNNRNTISFYPNPSGDVIRFPNILETSHLDIYDVTGKKIFSQKLDADNNQLNIEFLSEGIYSLKINRIYAGKLIKSK